MGLSYAPVLKTNVPEITAEQINTTTLDVAGTAAIFNLNVNTVTSTGNVTVGGTFTVTGTSQFNSNATFPGITVTQPASMNNILAAAVDVNTLTVTPPSAGIGVITVQPNGDTDSRFQVVGTGDLHWGSGSVAADTSLTRSGVNALSTPGFFAMGSGQTGGTFNVFGGTASALSLGTVGGGLAVKGGANARAGEATLTLGSATVTNTSVTADDIIMLTVQQIGTVSQPKAMTIANLTPGVSFQIVSEDATDTSTVAWFIVRVTA